MKFWWVNHKQTQRQELAGGYLWSPKVEKNGSRSKFYDNMRVAAPGDFVFSYASTKIARIGVVTDFAVIAPKPTEFRNVGTNWGAEGWILPVSWFDRAIGVKPKAILSSLASILPKSHSPLQSATGKGNQKAYLAEVSREVFAMILGEINATIGDFDQRPTDGPSQNFVDKVEDLIEQSFASDPNLNDTVRSQVIQARRGQGIFRSRVLECEPICRVTGISDLGLLVASHMKPWRMCTSAHERLAGRNGLMLAPHVDFLFDDGLLTFDETGELRFSSRLSKENLARLGLKGVQPAILQPFHRDSVVYLRYHQINVFKS
ncbi:HNH endonuclease [Rhizobium mongolense]|uniref:HNH endonuclease n=1 Tax=Rhizobium mongolense TaxID=57676 RepID=UPI003558068C